MVLGASIALSTLSTGCMSAPAQRGEIAIALRVEDDPVTRPAVLRVDADRCVPALAGAAGAFEGIDAGEFTVRAGGDARGDACWALR